jgi:hypothetical protein
MDTRSLRLRQTCPPVGDVFSCIAVVIVIWSWIMSKYIQARQERAGPERPRPLRRLHCVDKYCYTVRSPITSSLSRINYSFISHLHSNKGIARVGPSIRRVAPTV